MEDKESKRNIGRTSDKTEDVVTTYQFDEDYIPVMESPDDLESRSKEFRKNWKLSTHFE